MSEFARSAAAIDETMRSLGDALALALAEARKGKLKPGEELPQMCFAPWAFVDLFSRQWGSTKRIVLTKDGKIKTEFDRGAFDDLEGAIFYCEGEA